MKDQISANGIYDFCKELWPINRSLTGPGVIETLELIKSFLPNLKIHSYQSGAKKFDWIISIVWSSTYGGDEGSQLLHSTDSYFHRLVFVFVTCVSVSISKLQM